MRVLGLIMCVLGLRVAQDTVIAEIQGISCIPTIGYEYHYPLRLENTTA